MIVIIVIIVIVVVVCIIVIAVDVVFLAASMAISTVAASKRQRLTPKKSSLSTSPQKPTMGVNVGEQITPSPSPRDLSSPKLPSLDSTRKQLFLSSTTMTSPSPSKKKEPFRLNWLDYDNIFEECTKYSTDDFDRIEDALLFLLDQFSLSQLKLSYAATIAKLGDAAPESWNSFPSRKKDLIGKFSDLILAHMSILPSHHKTMDSYVYILWHTIQNWNNFIS